MAGRRGEPGPDPLVAWVDGLPAHWQPPLRRALGARDRFVDIVARVPPGPTRDRLVGMRTTVEDAVRAVADATWRAMNASEIAAGLDVGRATDELKAARRDLEAIRAAGGDTASAESLVAVLAERHRATNRAVNLAEDAAAELDRFGVRLDTAVAHAATVALRTTQDDGVDRLDGELRDVLDGLAALDAAFRDLSTPPA